MRFYLLIVCLLYTSCYSSTLPYDSYDNQQQKNKKAVRDRHEKLTMAYKELPALIKKGKQFLQEQGDESSQNSARSDAFNQEQTAILDYQIESAPYPIIGLHENLERCEVFCLGAIAYGIRKLFCPRFSKPSGKEQ